ncbi:unnamed protein product, partial [Ectocarpus sp. 8 AP-2014]
MRGATFAAALGSLQFLEMSRVYHYIRGQAMVKLYVLIAMVEIFDKASRFVLGIRLLPWVVVVDFLGCCAENRVEENLLDLNRKK